MTKVKDKPKPKPKTKTKKPEAKKPKTEDKETTPYEEMVSKRLDMLKHQYSEYPRPEYLEEGESKLVPFLLTCIAELFVRSDIVMDNINAMNAARDGDSEDRSWSRPPSAGSVHT